MMEYTYKKINKKEMIGVGKTFNVSIEAKYINKILNENDVDLKFCYNIRSQLLTVVDYKNDFKEITIEYVA